MSRHPENAPVLDRGRLIARIAVERRNGKRIILTNGCFDMFHVGHLRYLEGAAALGGCVVTAVNDDAHIRRTRGADRPVIPETERAEIVSGIRHVDVVTIFHEDTVEELIRQIKPDFHAKGTDYTVETVPERAIVEEMGGRVAIVGDPKDHSSTELFSRVKGKDV